MVRLHVHDGKRVRVRRERAGARVARVQAPARVAPAAGEVCEVVQSVGGRGGCDGLCGDWGGVNDCFVGTICWRT